MTTLAFTFKKMESPWRIVWCYLYQIMAVQSQKHFVSYHFKFILVGAGKAEAANISWRK